MHVLCTYHNLAMIIIVLDFDIFSLSKGRTAGPDTSQQQMLVKSHFLKSQQVLITNLYRSGSNELFF